MGIKTYYAVPISQCPNSHRNNTELETPYTCIERSSLLSPKDSDYLLTVNKC